MVHDHQRAEDITQDVFISALRRMRATDAHIAFKPWIYEIAKNACIDAFRRSKRAEEVSYDVEDGTERLHLVSNGPTPDAAVDTRMSLDHLRGAFGGLSEAHHQILVMRELDGLSYRQIGERLGMSRPSVESTLFRARRRLSEEYEELVSGERCRRIQAIIAGATGGQVGTRDERKLARHVSHCQPCRRAALVAGFDPDALTPKRTVREKIAALLPLPTFLKRFVAGGGDHTGLLSTAASYAEPAGGGWVKLAAAASALALAGLGAHEVTTSRGGDKHDAAGVAAAADTPRTSAPTAGGVGEHGAAGATQRIASASGHGSKVHHTSSLGSSHSTKTTGAGGSSSSGSNAGGSAGSSSSSTTAAAAGTKGGSGGSDPVGDATRSIDQTVNGATGGSTQVPAVQLPTVQVPKLPGAPKVLNDTVGTVNGGVAGTTQTVNKTVGGVTTTVNSTVNQTTTTVNQTVNNLGGTVGGTTKAVGDTVKGVTDGAGKLLGGH
jgi:RNA polymerase sigma factor (sigma-70 family)